MLVVFIRRYFEIMKAVYNSWIGKRQSINRHFHFNKFYRHDYIIFSIQL